MMRENILIVDDEPDVLRILHKALLKEGFQVRTAAGGSEAIEVFKEASFDLVITDIRMPGTDGLEVIRMIRQLDEEAEIIILTGYPSVDIAVRTLKDYGAYDFLVKPLKDIGRFLVTVEKAMERRRLYKERKEHISELKIAYQNLKQEIKERRRTEESLRQRESELRIKTRNLQESNAALRVLLKKRDEDRAELEDKVLSNVRELVTPYLERLRKSRMNKQQQSILNILESNLNDIVSPFVHRLSDNYLKLTPSEIQVANLVRQGRTTKEIAELASLSPRTIESYRDSIRNKLGIKNRKINLRTYLLAIG